jgi:molecular chaperone HtpG
MLKKTFEFNPSKPIIKKLKWKVAEDKANKSIHDLINLLFKTALLTSDFVLDEPTSCMKHIHEMICLSPNIDEREAPAAIVKEVAASAEGALTLAID